MSKIDLLKELPKKDKEIFENYVCKFSHEKKEDFDQLKNDIFNVNDE